MSTVPRAIVRVRFAYLEASTSTCPRHITSFSCSPMHVINKHHPFCWQLPDVMKGSPPLENQECTL